MNKINSILNKFDIWDHSPIGMCVIDETYKIVFWNQCLADWTGLKKTELIGKSLFHFYPQLKEPKYKVRLDNIFNGGAPTIFSAKLHKYVFKAFLHNNEPRIQHTTVTAVPAGEEGTYYALFAVEDVTEMTHRIKEYKIMRDKALKENQQRKEAEKKLQESLDELEKTNHELEEKNIELDQFNFIVSHDLQAPLRTLSSFSKILQKDPENILSAKSLQYLEYIKNASKKMHLLINNLLNLSKSTRKTIDESVFPLDQCVDDALLSLQSQVEEKSAHINREKLQEISGDKILITQLYQNLIGNALKFVNDKNPQINITFNVNGDTKIFGVKDNGIGIDSKFTSSIFEPFKRVNSTKYIEGSGIGLAICKKIVERHGGNIWVESQLGGGTHFKFTLGNIN